MAYNNNTPVISRIDRGVRDTDFIPINELKIFDSKLDEIIKKFESSQSEDSSDALSIAKKLKDIEYNLYDALEFDSEGNIIKYHDKPDPVTGEMIPIEGKDSIYGMLRQLEEKYGEFVKLMGSDPNIDNWKIDLNTYYTDAINAFKNKLSGIFSNSAEAVTLEAKNDKSTDYVANEKVDLKKNQVMRLNPDLQSYIRTVNVLPSEQNKNYIAFEVGELEADSLVLNLKIQNGFLYSDINVVLDKGNWFITKEKVLGKEIDNKFEINVFKYSKNGKTSYVFCLNTDYPELDQYYNFEIEGLLVNGYSFNATGLTVDKHNEYYDYTMIDKNVITKPVYNETYYIKTSQSYETINEETGEKEILTREIYEPVTKLLAFEEDTDYYTRNTIFSFVKSFDFIHGEDDGFVKNNVFSDDQNQVVVEDLSYSGEVNALKVDYEISEAFDDDEDVDTNDYISNRNKLTIDDSVRMFTNGNSYVSVGKSPRKIDNKLAAAYGEEAFDIIDLRPGEIVNTNSHINKEISNEVYKKLNAYVSPNIGVMTENVLIDDNFDESRLYKLDDNLVYIKDDGTVYFQKSTGAKSAANTGWIKNNTIKDAVAQINDNENITNKLTEWNIDTSNNDYIIVTVSQRNDNIYEEYGHSVIYNNQNISAHRDSDIHTRINFGKNYKFFVIYKDCNVDYLILGNQNNEAATITNNGFNNNIKYSVYNNKIFMFGSSNYLRSSKTESVRNVKIQNYFNQQSDVNPIVSDTNKFSLFVIKELYTGTANNTGFFAIFDINSKNFLCRKKFDIFRNEEVASSGTHTVNIINYYQQNLYINFNDFIFDNPPSFEHLMPAIINDNPNNCIDFIIKHEHSAITKKQNSLCRIDYTNSDTSESVINIEKIYNVFIENKYLENYFKKNDFIIESSKGATQNDSIYIIFQGIKSYILSSLTHNVNKYDKNDLNKLYLHNLLTTYDSSISYNKKIFETKPGEEYYFYGKFASECVLIRISLVNSAIEGENNSDIRLDFIQLDKNVSEVTDIKVINDVTYFIIDGTVYEYDKYSKFDSIDSSHIYHDDREYTYYVSTTENPDFYDESSFRVINDSDLDIVDGVKQFKSGVTYYYKDENIFSVKKVIAINGIEMADVDSLKKYKHETYTYPGENTSVNRYINDGYYTIFKSKKANNPESSHNIAKAYTYQTIYEKVDTSQPVDSSVVYYKKIYNQTFRYYEGRFLYDYSNLLQKIPAGTLTDWEYEYTLVNNVDTPDKNTEYFTYENGIYTSTGDPGTLDSFDSNTKYYTRKFKEYFTKIENALYMIAVFQDIERNGHEDFQKFMSFEVKETTPNNNEYISKYLYMNIMKKSFIMCSNFSPILTNEYSFKFLNNKQDGSFGFVEVFNKDIDLNKCFISITKPHRIFNNQSSYYICDRIIYIEDVYVDDYVSSPNYTSSVSLNEYGGALKIHGSTYRVNKFYKPKQFDYNDIYFIHDNGNVYKTYNFPTGNPPYTYFYKDYIMDKSVTNMIESSGEIFYTTNKGIIKEYTYIPKLTNDPSNLTPEKNENVYNDSKLYLTNNEYFRADILNDESILDNLLKSDDPDIKRKLKIINKYIRDNIVFINSFQIGIFKRNTNTVDIIVIPDDSKINNGEFYTLFTLNLSTDYYNKSSTEKVLVYRGLTKLEEEFINKKILWQEKWTSIVSNNVITLAMGSTGLFYSFNNDIFHKLDNPITENTHEPIYFDDSYELIYDGYKNFFAIKKDKRSEDHEGYLSDNGIIWKKFDMNQLPIGLSNNTQFVPRIYVTNPGKTWFIGNSNVNTVMLDDVALENLINEYTKKYVTKKDSIYNDSVHIYTLPFKCVDLFYTDDYFYALDFENQRFVYAVQSNSENTNEYITTWNEITIENQAFTSNRIEDFKIYGYDIRGAILYGSGERDSTTKGIWVAAYDQPSTFTKSNLPSGVGVKEFYPCVSIYKEDNGSESSRDFIFIKGTDDNTYKTEDFGFTWEQDTSNINEVLHVGSFNNWYMIMNTDSGIKAGLTKNGIPTELSNYRQKLINPKACISRNLINTVGYNVFHITDDSSGKILFSTDLINFYSSSVVTYNPITELNDSGDRIIGSTTMYPIAVNNNYDESYCPVDNSKINESKTLNEKSVYTEISETGRVLLHIDDKIFDIPNSAGINPTNFLVLTSSNTKIRYALCSETAKGLWISDECDVGTFSGELTHIQMDIYVEKGFQTSKGFFIYGKTSSGKTKIYFTSTSQINKNEIEFTEKLSVDYLDYIKSHNDYILISTYDIDHPYDKYSFNNETLSFEKETAVDISDVFSFNNTFEYEGDIYFINGSGSNVTVRSDNSNNEGIFRIRKSLNSSGSISFEITPFVLKTDLYQDISAANGQVFTGIIQTTDTTMLLIISGKNEEGTEFVVHKYIIDFESTLDSNKIKEINNNNSIINRYDNPILYDINLIVDHESDNASKIYDIDRSGSSDNIPNYGFIIQNNSFRTDINNLTDNALSLDNKVDEFYFDKSNKTLELNNYGITGTNDFKLNSEKVAYNASINTNKQAIVIALGQDNAMSIFDKDFDCLKVLTTGYYDRTTGQDIFVKLDPEYNNLQSVIIGVNNSEVKVYGLYYGKFPKFETDVDTGKRYLDYSKSLIIYKVYSIDYEILKSSVDQVVLNEETSFIYDAANNNVRTELKEFIRSNKYMPSKDLDLNDDELQVIVSSSNILYKNTYSLVVWNSKKKCIQVYTKYKADDSLINPNDTTNTNEKISSVLEGLDFQRDALYTNIENPYSKENKLSFIKYSTDFDSDYTAENVNYASESINTKKFVANLTNRKNLFLTSENDYKNDILFDPSKYLKYMQTRYGVFRFLTEDYVKAVNLRLGTNFVYDTNNFNKISGIPLTYRSLENVIYFTTEGSNSIIQIAIGNKGTVVNIWETINFLFIQTKEYINYLGEEQEVYKLYRMDNIPDTNKTEIISIHNKQYFTEMDTKYARVYDMLDTLDGLVCCATEPKGISNEVENDPDIYTGQTYVFVYNGEDFATVRTWDHNDPSTWVKFTNIIQTVNHPLFIDPIRKKVFSYDAANNNVYDANSNQAFDIYTDNNQTSLLDLLESYEYGRKYNPNYPNPIPDIIQYDNVIYLQKIQSDDASIHCITYAWKETHENNVSNMSLKRVSDVVLNRNSDDSYANIDTAIDKRYSTTNSVRYPIVKPSDSSRNYNSDFIQNILTKNIPLNKPLKVMGSLVCNGVRFNASSMKIETHPGENNKEVKSLLFNVDKYFRSNIAKDIFTDEPGVIRIGYGNVEQNIQKINIIILY